MPTHSQTHTQTQTETTNNTNNTKHNKLNENETTLTTSKENNNNNKKVSFHDDFETRNCSFPTTNTLHSNTVTNANMHNSNNYNDTNTNTYNTTATHANNNNINNNMISSTASVTAGFEASGVGLNSLLKLRNYGSRSRSTKTTFTDHEEELTFISNANVAHNEDLIVVETDNENMSAICESRVLNINKARKYVKEETIDARAELAEKLQTIKHGYAVHLDFGRAIGAGQVDIPAESSDVTPVMSMEANTNINGIGMGLKGRNRMNSIKEENENELNTSSGSDIENDDDEVHAKELQRKKEILASRSGKFVRHGRGKPPPPPPRQNSDYSNNKSTIEKNNEGNISSSSDLDEETNESFKGYNNDLDAASQSKY